jgi:hypothetical protein
LEVALKSFEKLNSDQYQLKICEFIETSSGLNLTESENQIKITQKADNKTIELTYEKINEVILRWDAEGKKFLQINFEEDKKILLTDKLIGFKPQSIIGLDMKKLPNVVTTSDLLSILEAIEESLLEGFSYSELKVLKNVYEAVLKGGESIGFDLKTERDWVTQISRHQNKASA